MRGGKPMKANKRTALEKNGWKIGSAEDFLELSADERAFVEAKLEKSHAGGAGKV